MKNRIQLHQLIHHLSKSDKRAFKLYIKKYKSEKEQKSEQLFDLLNKMPEYEESQLLTISSKSQLSYDLHILKITLLNALSDIHFKNKANSPGEIINRIELGLRYKAIDIIENNLKKGYSLANKEQNLSFELHLLRYEKTLRLQQRDLEALLIIDEKILEKTHLWNQNTAYHRMWLEVANWYGPNLEKEEPSPLIFSEQRFRDLFNAPIEEQANFKTKERYLLSKINYFDVHLEKEKSLKMNGQLLKLYLNNATTPSLLNPLAVLYNIILHNLDLGKIEKAEEALAQLDFLNHLSLEDLSRKNFHLFLSNLILLYKKDYSRIVEKEPEIFQLYSDPTFKTVYKNDDIGQLIFGLIIALFKQEEYAKCIDWILKGKNLKKNQSKTKTVAYSATQLIELFSHLELGHAKLVASLVNSLRYNNNLKKDFLLNLDRNETLRIAKSIIKKEKFNLDLNLYKSTSPIGYQAIFHSYFEKKQKEFDL